MATRPETVEHILDQAAGAGALRAAKMFGEYALYCGVKLVALICDDMLFVKITKAGGAIIADAPDGTVTEASPYQGAKPCYRIEADQWDDAEWLSALIAASARELPEPKPKKVKRKG